MDGIGYWIFLMLVYLVSGLLNKKKNKSALDLENQDKDQVSKSKIDKIFDYLNIEDTIVKNIKEKDNDLYDIELEETSQVRNINDNDFVSHPKDDLLVTDKSDFIFSKSYKNKEFNYLNRNYIKRNILLSKNKIKETIILKELLDKPLALRKKIID